MKINDGKIKSIFLLGSLAMCLMIFSSIEVKSEEMSATTDTTMTSAAVSSSLSVNDINNCDVLLGRIKKNDFNAYLDSLKNMASGGEIEIIKNYADVLQIRFTCIENEITGNSTWLQYEQDQNGKIIGEGPRKIIASIRSNTVAFNALKEAVSAYTIISDKNVGARMILSDYYLRYREALGNTAEGYKLLSGVNIVTCIKGNIDDDNKFLCNLIAYQLRSYKKIISSKKIKKLDELASVWSKKYLEDIELGKEVSENRG